MEQLIIKYYPIQTHWKKAVNEKDCKCNPGWLGSDGDNCTQCQPGEYKPESVNMSCTKCTTGTYSPNYGATTEMTCSNCPKNSNSSERSGHITDCTCIQGTSDNDNDLIIPQPWLPEDHIIM